MQENLIQNLDKSLDNILNQLGMGFYKHNLNYYLLDKSKLKGNGESYTYKGKKFEKSEQFFQQVNNHYHPNIRVEKESRNLFIKLYQTSTEEGKSFLLNHYDYFITFDQAFNYLQKIDATKKKSIYFVTHNVLKGKLREVEKEEKLLMKIQGLEPESFYENLLAYLSNHSYIYTQSIFSHFYQGMLKNLINEYLPNKRKNFSIFTGDSKKKYLNNSSILYENEEMECEIVLKLNKTVMEETYVPEILKEKHEITSEQGKIIGNIENLLKESKRLNLNNVYTIYTDDREILTLYIMKKNNDINKKDIVKFIDASLLYWKNNIQELKDLKIEEMIKKIANNAEMTYLHNDLLEKLTVKGYKEKKVKI